MIAEYFQWDWTEITETLFLLFMAFLFALPLGWNREARSHSAGLRTFPLVSMACCAFMRIGMLEYTAPEPQARLAYGIITGIGFIGGGAILKGDASVTGTATAASIWSTGAMGMAVAAHRFEIAIALSVVNFLTLWLGRKWKDRMNAST